MILKCTTSLMGASNEVLETSYHDRPCNEATSGSIDGGKYALQGSGPIRLSRFFLTMLVLGAIVYKALDYRRQNILNEVYSKLTIVKNKST